MTPSAKRQAIALLVTEHRPPVRRACQVVRLTRAAWYRPPPASLVRDAAVIEALTGVVAGNPRWGFWTGELTDPSPAGAGTWVYLHTEGWRVNRKRGQRLYRLEGLAVRRRAKRRRSDVPRFVRVPLNGPHERWRLDFVQDTLGAGRHFRCLTILDEYRREALAIPVAPSIPASEVIAVWEQLRRARGLPAVLVTDNGSEFRSRAFDAWGYSRDVELEFIQPGKPQQNGFIESFNGIRRDDGLNPHWFLSLERARIMIEAWRQDCNQVRPHSALNEQTPAEFLAAFTPEQRIAQQPERVQ